MKRVYMQLRLFTRNRKAVLLQKYMTWEEADALERDIFCTLRALGKRFFEVAAFYDGKLLVARHSGSNGASWEKGCEIYAKNRRCYGERNYISLQVTQGAMN